MLRIKTQISCEQKFSKNFFDVKNFHSTPTISHQKHFDYFLIRRKKNCNEEFFHMNNLLRVNSTIKVNLFDDASFFYFSHFCYVDKIKLYKFPLLRYCRYHHINDIVWATQKIYNVVKKRWAKFSSLISLLSHHQVTHCCAIKLRKNAE